jgi:uncharacterized protein YjbJ (UPF0337 family)
VNSDQFSGKWRQMRGAIKKQWGKLTDDDLDKIGGNYDLLVGKIQERYGNTRDVVERKLADIDREPAA